MAVSVERIKAWVSWGLWGAISPTTVATPVGGDYGEIAADVLEALEEDGFEMTLVQTNPGTYDPVTGERTGAQILNYSVWGLISSQSMPQSGNTGERYLDGVLIQTGDKMAILAAAGLAVTPQPGDQLIISGVTWQIVTLITVEPGGVALFYRVLVRK